MHKNIKYLEINTKIMKKCHAYTKPTKYLEINIKHVRLLLKWYTERHNNRKIYHIQKGKLKYY